MVENFWQNYDNNGGKCTYWNAIEKMDLKNSEKKVCDFIRTLEENYKSVNLGKRSRPKIEDVKILLPNCRTEILEALTKCAVMTNNFVPIEDILFSWEGLAYEQENALWRGTGYKGHYAFAKNFICKELNKSSPSTEKLFAIHKNLEQKNLVLENVYAEHLDWTKTQSRCLNVWDSLSVGAANFRQQVVAAYPRLAKKIQALHTYAIIAQHNAPVYPVACVLEKS